MKSFFKKNSPFPYFGPKAILLSPLNLFLYLFLLFLFSPQLPLSRLHPTFSDIKLLIFKLNLHLHLFYFKLLV